MITVVVIGTVVFGGLVMVILNLFVFGKKSVAMLPPAVAPCLPMLGNALDYKKAPHAFMFNATKRYGAIFRINLAGLETIIVTTKTGMRQLAMAPESVLSSRQAVSDFGFLYTLGHLNVTEGASFHKYVVKNNYFKSNDLYTKARYYHTLLPIILEQELTVLNDTANSIHAFPDSMKVHLVPDFQYFTRRVFLTLNIIDFLGRAVLDMYNATGMNLTTEFLQFQDTLEDAIAQATVLPRVLALPLYLQPVERRRGAIVQKLAHIIEEVWAKHPCEGEGEGAIGVWLMEIHRNNNRLRNIGTTVSNSYQREFSATEAAELCCGLLFASHKNPSLAASQTVLFMLEQHTRHPDRSVLDLASAEAIKTQAAYESSASVNESTAVDMRVIHSCVHETLRLTAHTIGSVRKVVDPRGFTFNITDADSVGDMKNKGKTISYTIPCGSYISESHFVPNCLRMPDLMLPKFELNYEEVLKSSTAADVASGSTDDYEFTTFSHGVHKCVGQHLAIMMDKLYIGALLSKYKLFVQKQLPEVSFERATLAQRAGKCEVCLTPR